MNSGVTYFGLQPLPTLESGSALTYDPGMTHPWTICIVALVTCGLFGNAHARQPPHPLINTYKVKTRTVHLSAFWVSKDAKKKEVTEAEFFILPPRIVKACKGKTRSKCPQLSSQIHSDSKKKAVPIRASYYPRKYWNFGKKYDAMMKAIRPKMRADYRKRLYRWIVKRIPRKRMKSKPSPSLDAHVYQSSNIGYEPPIRSIKTIKAVILELTYDDYSGAPYYFVLDLKL